MQGLRLSAQEVVIPASTKLPLINEDSEDLESTLAQTEEVPEDLDRTLQEEEVDEDPYNINESTILYECIEQYV